MYQVIETYGDNEPWWFFENWQQDIQKEKDFVHLNEAVAFFGERAHELLKNYPEYRLHSSYSAAFWQANDMRWCEECDDSLQQYKGLLLLKDGKEIQPLPEKIKKEVHEEKKLCAFFKRYHEQ